MFSDCVYWTALLVNSPHKQSATLFVVFPLYPNYRTEWRTKAIVSIVLDVFRDHIDERLAQDATRSQLSYLSRSQ